MIVLLATISLAVLGLLALCGLFVLVIQPRMAGRSPLTEPANPNMSAAEFNRRGNALYRQKLYKRAAVEYGHMIEKSPEDASGYLLRAMAEEEMGDYKGSVRDNTEGLKHTKLTPVRDNLYFNRGLANRYLSAYKSAIADFSQAIALNPNNTEAYESRAFCYKEMGDYDRAVADYTVAIGRNPHPGTVFERGQAYLKKKEYPVALADFNRSLKDRPGFVPGYRLRADTFVAMKQYAMAVVDAETALRYDNSAASRGSLGWYQYLAGRLPEAIANSQAAIKTDPNTTFARFNLGLCYATQGDADAMKTAYQEALSHAKPADIQGGLQDVKDALKTHPNSATLKQAEALLQDAPAPATANG
jgi:tetratricopeptide (TPR) repeat protein